MGKGRRGTVAVPVSKELVDKRGEGTVVSPVSFKLLACKQEAEEGLQLGNDPWWESLLMPLQRVEPEVLKCAS